MADRDVFDFEGTERDLRFRPVDPRGAQCLTSAQVEHFNERGFVPRLPLFDPDEAADFRHYMDWLIDEVVSADDRRNSYSINNYHQFCQRLHDLVTNPSLVAYVQDILGPELVCWSTHAFCKLPNDGMDIPLHQDAVYWPFTPTRSVTAWLAIDDVDEENSAMRFAPGSHLNGPMAHDIVPLDGTVVLNRRVVDHKRFTDTYRNDLGAGQVSLHTDLLLHGSPPNTSNRRRCGITVRYLAAEVRAVAGSEDWIKAAVHVGAGDPGGYWPNRRQPEGEDAHRLSQFSGGFDGNR